jgi:uncharacterized protein involved in exopolysaccharide biosynthesis
VRKITPQDHEVGFRLNLGEYLRVLWRKKYFLIVPLAISILVSNIGIRFLVPEYESSSVIRVGDAAHVQSEVNRFVQTDRRDSEFGAQLTADIQGSAFLDELIRRLGMDQDPKLIDIANYEREHLYPGITSEELVMRRLRNFLKRRIHISREGPNMYRLAYADANPEACYVVAEAITRLYIDMQHRQTMQGLKEVSQFSEEQLAVYKERLDKSEQELANFQERLSAPSLATNPVNQTNVALSERVHADLDLTISGADDTLERIQAQVVAILGAIPDGDRVFRDPEIRKLENDLAMRRESELLAELSASTTGTTPGAGSTSEGIMATQQALQRRLGRLVGERFSNVSVDYRPLVVEYFYQRAEVNALRTKRTKLDSYLRAFRSQLALAPEMESELTRLRQEVERNRSVYNTFQSAQTSTQISEAAQNTELGASVVLVEAASRPLAPVRPDHLKILVLAFLFGAAIGASGLLLTEFTDSSFRSVDEIEKQLGMKVLGTIPRFEKTKWFHDSARKRAVVWTATSVVFLGVALAGFYFYGKSVREQMIDLNLNEKSTTTTTP